MSKEVSHILFVCRYNRFRSVITEAFFKKYNKNKSVTAKSAGAIKGRPIGEHVKQIAKEYDLKIKKAPHGLTSDLMVWQNITVVVANDVPSSLFDRNKEYGKKVIIWKIPDVKTDTLKEMRDITNEIEKRVINLTRKLNK